MGISFEPETPPRDGERVTSRRPFVGRARATLEFAREKTPRVARSPSLRLFVSCARDVDETRDVDARSCARARDVARDRVDVRGRGDVRADDALDDVFGRTALARVRAPRVVGVLDDDAHGGGRGDGARVRNRGALDVDVVHRVDDDVVHRVGTVDVGVSRRRRRARDDGGRAVDASARSRARRRARRRRARGVRRRRWVLRHGEREEEA